MIHVTFCASGAGILRQALRQYLGPEPRDEKVLALSDDMSFGPIERDVRVRMSWMAEHVWTDPDEWDWLAESVERFWEMALSASEVTVWFSKRSTKEYSGYLEWLSRVADKPCHYVDVSDAEFMGRDGRPRAMVAIPLIHPELLPTRYLLENRYLLSADATKSEAAHWARLRDDHSVLRILDEHRRLVSAPITFWDNLILSCARVQWLKVARVVGQAMAESSDCTMLQVGDVFLTGRVAALVRIGALESQGDLRDPRASEIRIGGSAI